LARPGDRQSRFQQRPERDDKHAINEFISAPEVRVIGANGEQLGILRTIEARRIAEESGYDLVEVAPEASPPVCKILDYGKLRYKEQKKAAESRKRSSTQQTKEIRLRYSTDKHDIDTKVRHARKFLEEGDRVKFEMRFRGREVTYQQIGREILDRVAAMLDDIGIIDERTDLVGQRMILTFAPKPHGPVKPSGKSGAKKDPAAATIDFHE
jgi:translation initiation factor IF-3